MASLDVLLSTLTILSFDESAGRRFGALKAALEAGGEPVDNLDLQIASIVIENDFPLLTNNANHFKRIEALRLENWIR